MYRTHVLFLRSLVLFPLLFTLLGPSAYAQAVHWEGPLDFEKMVKSTKVHIVPVAGLDKQAPAAFSAPHPVMIAEKQVAYVSLECKEYKCKPFLALLQLDEFETNSSVLKKVALPISGKTLDGYFIDPLIVYDMDGDGKKEIIVQYSEMGGERPGLGYVNQSYLVIFSKDLILEFQSDPAECGQAADDICCENALFVGRESASVAASSLKVQRTCKPRRCRSNPAQDLTHCQGYPTFSENKYCKRNSIWTQQCETPVPQKLSPSAQPVVERPLVSTVLPSPVTPSTRSMSWEKLKSPRALVFLGGLALFAFLIWILLRRRTKAVDQIK